MKTDPGTGQKSGPAEEHEEPETVTPREGVSPYATGGGGVTFERKVAVQYLAHLLVGDAAVELGDEHIAMSVAFQQGPDHPVDDLVLRAARPGESEPSLVLAIGVRRAPKLVQSDPSTQQLIREFVRAVITAPTDGPEYRFALAVSGPQPHAEQLAELADLATKQMDAPSYYGLVRTEKKFTAAIRRRLDQTEGLVKHALIALGNSTPADALVQRHTWDLLSRLTVLMPRLESPDESDWVRMRNSLVRVALGADLSGASRLRDRLVALADEYSPRAATIDLKLLRRDAHAVLDTTLRRHKQGWQALHHLHERALASVCHRVTTRDGTRFVCVDRNESASTLLATIAEASAVVVDGESGVGKSALVLSSVTAEATAAPHLMQALCINLRQLPATTVNFESTLGCPLATLLGELSAPQRCLVIDSADAIVEGRVDSFRYLIDAARTCDVKVIAVSAGDSKQIVHDAITQRLEASVGEHTVTPLTDAELDLIVATFTELASLSANPRSRDLLRRLVVVDLLVRGGVAGIPLNDADAMNEVWTGLVSRRGQSDRGSPVAREVALLRLADLALTGGNALDVVGALNPEALDGLRNDGLLRPSGDDPFKIGPEFAHDEVRRYAVARLLLQDSDPTARIVTAGAPRWALGAARIACQAMLALPDKPALPLHGRITRLQAAFNVLVDAGHGERWGDVPGEALLTMSHPDLLLRDAWSGLRADNTSGLRRLTRLIQQRHTDKYGIVSIVAIEPIVTLLLEDATPWRSGEHVAALIRDWLRAHVSARTPAGHSLRVRLRERLIEACDEADRRLVETREAADAVRAARSPEEIEQERQFMESHRGLFAPLNSRGSGRAQERPEVPREITDETVLELLALLGPDLGDDGKAVLSRVGKDAPRRLAPAIENHWTDFALASYGKGLLADLTEAYYLENGSDRHGSGIREHNTRCIGASFVAWSHGPFMCLLQTDFRNGVRVLNRMLNHAALVRVRKLADLDVRWEQIDGGKVESCEVESYKIELEITGTRVIYIGDDHVWRWYRGAFAVGPRPCMSALQALEQICEQYIKAGTPLTALTSLLLDGCENLAMVGLIMSLLVRHLERAGGLIDSYIAEPLIWRLEFARIPHEMRKGAASSETLVAVDRRSWSLREVAMTMALSANSARKAELRAVGESLVENARRLIAGGIGEDDEAEVAEQLAMVRAWASHLDLDTYTAHQEEDIIHFQSTPPADVAQVLESRTEEARRGHEAVQLFMRYCAVPRQSVASSVSDDDLTGDLAMARSLLEHLPQHGPVDPWDILAAIGSVALERRLLHDVAVSMDVLTFAADTVLCIGENRASRRPGAVEDAYNEQAADRSAARVLPLLLLPVASSLRGALDGKDESRTYHRSIAASANLGQAVALEVRLHLARGLDHVWEVPCGDERCHHDVALQIAIEMMRDCVVGEWDPEVGWHRVTSLEEPIDASLASVPDRSIAFNRLDAAIRALAPAVVANTCVSSRAHDLLMVLLAAQRRALLSYEKDMDSRGSHALVSARALLTLSKDGEDGPLYEHVDAYAGNPRLLGTFLRALSAAAEEAASRCAAAQRVWPTMIGHVLALNKSGRKPFGGKYHGEMALAALVPNATHEGEYLYREIENQPIVWWDARAWRTEIDAWHHIAAGDPVCVDRLISCLRALPIVDQVGVGLPRVVALVLADPNRVAARSFLVSGWLIDVRSHAEDVGSLPEWQRVVDALVVAGAGRLAPYSE